MFSIFFIVGFAVLLGLSLAMFATRQKLPGNAPLVPPEDDAAKDSEVQKVGIEDLFKLGEKLCEENQLKIKDKMNNSPREILWIAESSNDFFFGSYVLAFCEVSESDPYVTLSELLEFKDFIKSIGSTKGLFLTTGYFTRDVHQMLEGPKVSLFNKRKVAEELRKHHLA